MVEVEYVRGVEIEEYDFSIFGDGFKTGFYILHKNDTRQEWLVWIQNNDDKWITTPSILDPHPDLRTPEIYGLLTGHSEDYRLKELFKIETKSRAHGKLEWHMFWTGGMDDHEKQMRKFFKHFRLYATEARMPNQTSSEKSTYTKIKKQKRLRTV